MPKCKYHEICGLDGNTEEDLCILHSQDPEKDREKFDKALAGHRQKNGHNFQHFVFPGYAAYFKGFRFIGRADFSGAQFTEKASFEEAEFQHSADFRQSSFQGPATFFGAVFTEHADFAHAKFANGAYFSGSKFIRGAKLFNATFTKDAKFSEAEFTGWADFRLATFKGWTSFANADFTEGVSFSDAEFMAHAAFFNANFLTDASFVGAKFTEGADFSGTSFGNVAEFVRARFLGRTRFLSRQEKGKHIPIFLGTLVNFREVDMAPDAVVFQDADLRKCHFLGTDLRKTWFANVTWPEIVPKRWPKIGRRQGGYDEDWAEQKSDNRSIPQIEELYRQLKQNYEDRRDYERARHFHYGEKEMRRKNSGCGLWILLTAYRWVSGYGESCLLPFLSAMILLAATTAAYLCGGLLLPNKDASVMPNSTSLLDVGLYSLRVMTLLRPNDFMPIGFCGSFVNMIQSIFGPLLIGLFALALRQRLKR